MPHAKIAISVLAALLIVVHLMWPSLSIDSITIALLLIGVALWLIGVIQSAKLPGGWEITFRDLKAASDKIEAEKSVLPTNEKLQQRAAVHKIEDVRIVDTDANLALVSVRIEIEKRLRTLARLFEVNDSLPLTHLFRELRKKEVLSHPAFNSLEEIVSAGNRAAHGASVEPDVLKWATNNGWKFIGGLDALLSKHGS